MSVTQQDDQAPVGEARPDEARPAQPAKKPWSAPSLSVHSIDETTMGTRGNARTDGGNYFS